MRARAACASACLLVADSLALLAELGLPADRDLALELHATLTAFAVRHPAPPPKKGAATGATAATGPTGPSGPGGA